MLRLGRFCYRRRRLVLLVWVAALAALIGAAITAGGTLEDRFELPGTESQAAVDLLEEGGFATRAGAPGQLVIHAGAGVTDPAIERQVAGLIDDMRARISEITIVSPYEPEGQLQISPDGTIAFAELALADRSDRAFADAIGEIRALVARAGTPGIQLELGGDRFAEEAGGGGELVGLLAAIVILLVAFGSLLAMGLPILTALFGIGAGVALDVLLAGTITMPSFTLQLVIMLGIGVGIDYALFIVTRFRQALADGHEVAAAIELTIDTAGRAVLFAGITVVVSVLGLLVVGLDLNRALGIAAASGVAMTMLASITLLPAILGFVGRRIDRFGLPHRRATAGTSGIWYRWSRVIQRRPVLPALAGLLILVILALPTFSMRLGFGDAGNRPESDTTRRAYDLLAQGFGPGANGPLILAASVPGEQAAAAQERLFRRLETTEGVAAVMGAIANTSGDVRLIQVLPITAPQEEATAELVHRLRTDIIPDVAGDSGLIVHVGGAPAAAIDFADFNAARLPMFVAVVLAVSFVVLLIVFRSVLVPVKAVIMNLLSIGAAYGVIVAVFQWGWGAELLGVGKPGPVEAWAPMMLFAVVFGLSMDYEVFLLSRIREDYDISGNNDTAVAHGLAASARVITAAAAVMVVVFAGFVLSSDRDLQLFGMGLAAAVFLDATIVRLVLVPATMELLGDRNWWLPRPLERVLPAVHVKRLPPSAKEVFGERADRYGEMEVFSEEKYYLPLVEFAAPQPDDRVLDLATGTGLLALLMSRRAREVTGCDVTPEMLEKARARVSEGGQGNIRFVEAEAATLPFPDDSFDLVTCRAAFHHFPDPRAALAELFRVLAPGGRVVIADVVGYYGPGQERHIRERLEKLLDPSHILAYTAEEFAEMFAESGFEVGRRLEPETQPLPLEIILGLEKLNDPEAKAAIESILKAGAGSDLGGVEVFVVDGTFALRWHLLFIAASKRGDRVVGSGDGIRCAEAGSSLPG